MSDVPKEIQKLIEYDNLYYNDGISPISDDEYDILKNIVRLKYGEHEYFQEVGHKVDGNSVNLPFIIGSLNKVKIDTVEKWISETEGPYIITEKLDGVSILVKYVNGEVEFAATRGNGVIGRDITQKAKIFCPVMKNLDGSTFYIRGEAMLVGNMGEKLGFKNNRNGVAGIIGRDDTKNCQYITPFFYEIIESDLLFGYEYDRYSFLKSHFSVPRMVIFDVTNSDNLTELLLNFKKSSIYEIDGLVLTPYEYKRENVLRPKNKVAFKINEDAVEAIVRYIEWNVSRTGRVVPVVHIEPTEIGGRTMGKITGHNAKFIQDNKICKGKKIKVVFSGDVIPYIIEVMESKNSMILPTICPDCGDSLVWKGVDLCCNNGDCGGQTIIKIEYFLRTLGAENITRKTLEKLNVKTIKDVYELDEYTIASFDGFGVKRGEQIVNEIQGTLKTTPEQFIAALGIPGVSLTMSKNIVSYINSKFIGDGDEYQVLCSLGKKDLLEIDGIGEILANNIINNDKNYMELYEYLKNKGLSFKREEKNDISGVIFTLTGKGNMGRNVYQKMISSKGGIVKGISKNTNYLVTNDLNSKSGKAKKAREYGIEMIDYNELEGMLYG